MSDSSNERRGLDRRTFLHGTGAASALATSLTVPTETDAQEKAGLQFVGPGAVEVGLTVNGKKVTTKVEPRVTLLDALRDYLDVTGCKRVCDRGTCGACTVLYDGKPIYACSRLAVEAQAKPITTCEGLMDGEKMHAIQQAFCDHDASQCGFCTPGFVTACAAVIKQNPKATVEQVKEGLSGNICRCGTYEQMAGAIAQIVKTG